MLNRNRAAPRRLGMKRAAAFILAVIASGVMIVLALPPCGIWVFGWIALAPVFLVTRQTRLLLGAVAGIAASMVAAFIAAGGYFYRVGDPGGNDTWTYLGLAIFGFVFAVVAGIGAEVKDRSLKSLLAITSSAILLQFALLFLLPAPLELSQARVPPMLLLASVTGIWGLGFVIWFYNFAVAEVMSGNRKLLRPVVALPVLLAIGYLLAPLIMRTEGPYVRVGVVQSWTMELSQMQSLSEAAAEKGAVLVVWPELSGIAYAPGGDTSKLRFLATQVKMPAFVTSYRDDFMPMPHNTAALFSHDGESVKYFKRKLFGGEVTMHTAGELAVAVPSPAGRLGLNICFDSCYPAMIRDTVRQNADIIALPTIDPESSFGFFAANHAAFTPIRAAENGVSMIRADGSAYSVIVDSYGRVKGELGTKRDQVATALVPVHGHWTFYRWAGDWFLYACAGFLVWAILSGRKAPASRKALPPIASL